MLRLQNKGLINLVNFVLAYHLNKFNINRW